MPATRIHRRGERTALPAHVTSVIGPSPARGASRRSGLVAGSRPARSPDHRGAARGVGASGHRRRCHRCGRARGVRLALAGAGEAARRRVVAPAARRRVTCCRASRTSSRPDPQIQAAVVAEAEALVRDALAAAEAVVAPSPARAEPHDPAAWLPLPSIDDLPPVEHLLEPAATPPGGRTGRRRLTRFLPPARAMFVGILVVATVLAGGWAGSKLMAPGGSKVTLLVDGPPPTCAPTSRRSAALLASRHVKLGAADSVVPSSATSLARRLAHRRAARVPGHCRLRRHAPHGPHHRAHGRRAREADEARQAGGDPRHAGPIGRRARPSCSAPVSEDRS